jgi:hypothetical protein
MPSCQLDTLIDGAEAEPTRLCARGPPLALRWSIARCKGGSAMRKLKESLLLVLARLRRIITGPR